MFCVNDYLIFKKYGVCKVIAVETPSFVEDKNKKYYKLAPVFPKDGLTVIYTPVDREDVIRPVMEAGEAGKLLDSVPSMDVSVFESSKPNLLSAHYSELLSSFEFRNYLYLLKEIYLKEEAAKKKEKHLSQIDQHYRDEAEKMIFDELAFIFGLTREEAKQRFVSIMQKHQKNKA